MMVDIRSKARTALSKIGEHEVIASNGADGKFSRLTNVSQKMLEDNWFGPSHGNMTACNGFTGWYGNQLGKEASGIGVFELESWAKAKKKGYAWIPAGEGRRPKYGDVCRHVAFHVDVAIGFEGDRLRRAAAGQGGKGVGYDILKKVLSERPFYDQLQGWIDIDLLFNGPQPEWLLGWWRVESEGQTYYYCFDEDRRVTWTQHRPGNVRGPMPAAYVRGTGRVTVDAMRRVRIAWQSGTNEEFRSPTSTEPPEMPGVDSRSRAPLLATGML